MRTIAIIMPYFGSWPAWKDLFFNSCASNSDVDFFFYTDCGTPDSVAPNMHFHDISFVDYCAKASSAIGVSFSPLTYRKLRDLRPFYGVIHYEEIKDYDFWGFGDVDLVFGNIRKFYNDDILERFDILSAHVDRISGHFAVIRNNDHYRNLCFSMWNWRNELQREGNSVLDESEFSYQIHPSIRPFRILYAKMWKYFGWDFASGVHYRVIPLLNRVARLESRRIRYKQMNIHPHWSGSDYWIYYPGSYQDKVRPRLMDVGNDEECIYCHFLPYKSRSSWRVNPCKERGIFVASITPQGILPVVGE